LAKINGYSESKKAGNGNGKVVTEIRGTGNWQPNNGNNNFGNHYISIVVYEDTNRQRKMGNRYNGVWVKAVENRTTT